MNVKCYLLSTFADYGKKGWCYAGPEPEGIGYQSYRLASGEELTDYPTNPDDVTLKLDIDSVGIKKGAIVGNSSFFLIVDSKTAEIIQQLTPDGIRYYPFTLINHKGRVHSRDYVFVNPLGAGDYLNIQKSDVSYDKKGNIKVIRKEILDEKKLKAAPNLFRMKPIPRYHYILEPLKVALEKAGTTNLHLNEVGVA
jgi:hypothetical protein